MDLTSGSMIGKILRLPLQLLPNGTTMPILSGPLRGGRWVTGTADHGSWIGIYERGKTGVFANQLKPGQTVYDLGAHVGYYALIASRLVGPEGRVVAVEPFPGNLKSLNRHLELNKVTNVEVIAAAVGDEMKTIFLKGGPTTTTGKISDQGTLEARCVTLDHLVYSDGLPAPDVIKIGYRGRGNAGSPRR